MQRFYVYPIWLDNFEVTAYCHPLGDAPTKNYLKHFFQYFFASQLVWVATTSRVMSNRSKSVSGTNQNRFSRNFTGVLKEQSNLNVKKPVEKFPRRKNSFGANGRDVDNSRDVPHYSQTTTDSSVSHLQTFEVYYDDSGSDEVIDMDIEDGDFYRVPNQRQQHTQEIAQHKQTIKDLQNLVKKQQERLEKQQEQLRSIYSEREKYKEECQRCI